MGIRKISNQEINLIKGNKYVFEFKNILKNIKKIELEHG